MTLTAFRRHSCPSGQSFLLQNNKGHCRHGNAPTIKNQNIYEPNYFSFTPSALRATPPKFLFKIKGRVSFPKNREYCLISLSSELMFRQREQCKHHL